MRRVSILLVSLAASAVLAPIVLADGATRRTTPEEKKAATRTLTLLSTAAPKGPTGWTEQERTEIEAPELVTDLDDLPVTLEFVVAWRDQAASDKADAAGQEAVEGQIKSRPADEQLWAEHEKIAEAFAAAAERGDQKELERLSARRDAVAAKLEKIHGDQNAALETAVARAEVRDLLAQLTFVTNSFQQTFNEPATPEAKVAGFPVYRIGNGMTTNQGWEEGTTCVFLGPWRMEDGAMTSTPRPGASSTGIQTLVVCVKAEKKRARSLVESVNWASLNSALQK